MIRRQQWLSAVAPEDASASQEAPPVPAQASSRDKYGVDLNEFKMLLGKKPRDWKKAVRGKAPGSTFRPESHPFA